MEQRKVSREQRIRRCVFLILAYVVRANLLRQAIRDFLIKITGTTQRTIWEQEGVVYLYIRTRIGRVIDIISQIIKSHELTSPGTSDYRRYWWPSMLKGKKSNVLPSYRRGWSVLARKKNYYTCHVNAVNNVSRPLHSNLICEYLSSILLIQLVEKVYEKYTISVRWVLSATITIFLSSATFSLLRTEKRNIRICITIFRFREKIEYGCYVGKKEDTRTLEWNDK